jgi:hypothetical protein
MNRGTHAFFVGLCSIDGKPESYAERTPKDSLMLSSRNQKKHGHILFNDLSRRH